MRRRRCVRASSVVGGAHAANATVAHLLADGRGASSWRREMRKSVQPLTTISRVTSWRWNVRFAQTLALWRRPSRRLLCFPHRMSFQAKSTHRCDCI